MHINGREKASLTVEASMVVPLFFLLLLPFLFLIRSVYVYDCVESAVCETTRRMESLLYLAEKTGAMREKRDEPVEEETEIAVTEALEGYASLSDWLKSLGEESGAKAIGSEIVLQQAAKIMTSQLLESLKLEDWGLEDGTEGISYALSEFGYEEDGRSALFAVTACYSLSFPFAEDFASFAPVYIRCTGRAMVGQEAVIQEDSGEQDAENVWYRIGSGTHYHRRDCYLIAKAVVSISQEDALRSGYRACLYCHPSSERVWVTEGGERYHEQGCRYIQPDLIPVTEEEIERCGYLPCSICVGGGAWFS